MSPRTGSRCSPGRPPGTFPSDLPPAPAATERSCPCGGGLLFGPRPAAVVSILTSAVGRPSIPGLVGLRATKLMKLFSRSSSPDARPTQHHRGSRYTRIRRQRLCHERDTDWLRLGIMISRPFARSPEKGARTAVSLAASARRGEHHRVGTSWTAGPRSRPRPLRMQRRPTGSGR